MTRLISLFILEFGLFAQSAEIFIPTPSETAAAKVAFEKLEAAKKEFEDTKADIVHQRKLPEGTMIEFNSDFTAFVATRPISQ